jgi:hypothetical protein
MGRVSWTQLCSGLMGAVRRRGPWLLLYGTGQLLYYLTMAPMLRKLVLWVRLQRKARSWDVWTRDHRNFVRHYQFRAVPTTLECAQYRVKLVRTLIGGSSHSLEFVWDRDKVIACQAESC